MNSPIRPVAVQLPNVREVSLEFESSTFHINAFHSYWPTVRAARQRLLWAMSLCLAGPREPDVPVEATDSGGGV